MMAVQASPCGVDLAREGGWGHGSQHGPVGALARPAGPTLCQDRFPDCDLQIKIEKPEGQEGCLGQNGLHGNKNKIKLH